MAPAQAQAEAQKCHQRCTRLCVAVRHLFEETLTPLLDFLGVGWDDGVRDYTKTAIERGKIFTPSYNQVTQPLYTRARGRWERYREQMQPVLPTLLPWAGHFGYGV